MRYDLSISLEWIKMINMPNYRNTLLSLKPKLCTMFMDHGNMQTCVFLHCLSKLLVFHVLYCWTSSTSTGASPQVS